MLVVFSFLFTIFLAYFINFSVYKFCKNIKKNSILIISIYFTMIFSWFLLYLKYGLNLTMIKYLILIAILIQISIVDFYTGYVYDIIVVIGLITRSIFLCIEWSLFGVLDLRFILDLLVIIIVTYLLAVFTKSLGMGDVGLYGLCAFNLGIEFGIYIIILSFLIAFFYIITLFFAKYILYRIKLLKENIFLNDVGFKGKKISSDVVFKGKSIPFTPFISIATVIVIFTEYKLLIWYFNFIEIFLS